MNLDSFLGDYGRHDKFLLIPAHLPNEFAQVEPIMDLPIGKHSLTVVNAWEIVPNDMTAVVLDLAEPPYIPSDQVNAPVIKTLEWLRAIRDGYADTRQRKNNSEE